MDSEKKLPEKKGAGETTPAEIVRWIAAARLPRGFKGPHLLGTGVIVLLLVQFFTGFLLSLYYHPSPELAHESVVYVIGKVPFGWLVRSVHYWVAEFLVVLVFLHALRVFVNHAYLEGRWANWMVGCVLLFLVLAFRFTGCFFAYDDVSYWRTVAGGAEVGKIPLVGGFLMDLFYGGDGITGDTLSRFYTFHIVMLPWVIAMVIALHLFIVRRQGLHGASGDGGGEVPGPRLFPAAALKGAALFLSAASALVLLAGYFPVKIGDKAVTYHKPLHVAPEWFFAGLKGFLSRFPGDRASLGYGLILLSWVLVLCLPFWVPRGFSIPARGTRLLVGAVILSLLIYFSFVGYH